MNYFSRWWSVAVERSRGAHCWKLPARFQYSAPPHTNAHTSKNLPLYKRTTGNNGWLSLHTASSGSLSSANTPWSCFLFFLHASFCSPLQLLPGTSPTPAPRKSMVHIETHHNLSLVGNFFVSCYYAIRQEYLSSSEGSWVTQATYQV